MPEIKLKQIQPNRLNPRLEFSKEGLDNLADSIMQVGLLEPIIVRPGGKERYEVVIGERRYRAAQQAGLDTVPVIIRNYTDEQVLELNLIENIQRADLSALEKAKVCQQLKERFPDHYPNWKKLSKRIGVGEDTVKEWLRTLRLPEEIKTMIAPRQVRRAPPGKIDYQTAIHIVEKVREPKKQVEVAKKLAQQHVPQRAAKEILKEVVKEPAKPVENIMRGVLELSPIYLSFSKAHADAILKRIKTQTARKAKDPRLQPGSIVKAQVTHFADLEVLRIERKRLGDFDERDAKREGGYTLAEFKQVWKRLHGEWDPNEFAYVVEFRLVKVVDEEA